MKKTNITLIPDEPNKSPDYYCTWQSQLYATCDGKVAEQRKIMDEHSLFCKEKPYGFAYFHEKARKDLILVMDDSWDVPVDNNAAYHGSLILDKGKFPSFAKDGVSNTEALAALNEKIKSIGWRSVGGWVCAQESELFLDGMTVEEYWIKRFEEADKSGFGYWKVDWGKKYPDKDFRILISTLARKYAPELVLENAIVDEVVPYSDAFRTYDVPEIMSIPMTMGKLAGYLAHDTVPPAKGIVSCEDELYMAASLGCAMGVMRHPNAGPFMDGRKDMSFPECHRNVKRRMEEVVRAARWHRVAPAYGTNGSETNFSDKRLTDFWEFVNTEEEIEAWWFRQGYIQPRIKDDVLTLSEPAAISRNLPIPEVTPDSDGNIPYITASKNPNGVISIATHGRTLGRKFYIPECDISVEAADTDTFGIFGSYKSLTLNGVGQPKTILAQDISGEYAYDITESVLFADGNLTIDGGLIEKIGKEQNAPSDISDAGLAVKLIY